MRERHGERGAFVSRLSSADPSPPLLGAQIDEQDNGALRFTGSQINYYFICKRKLWLFSHNIELEPESDLVKLGKLLHENSYRRKLKEVQVDRIKVDFLESEKKKNVSPTENSSLAMNIPTVSAEYGAKSLRAATNGSLSSTQSAPIASEKQITVHEVKRSKKMADAHLFQLLYYMYFLKRNYGVAISRGVLHYPLLKQNVDVFLTEERISQLEQALRGVVEVNSLPAPPEASWKGYCRSCAFSELCWG